MTNLDDTKSFSDDQKRYLRLILADMGVDEDERWVTATFHYANLDDGVTSCFVSVLQFRLVGDTSIHTLTRYIVHEVDDFTTYKRLDEVILTDADLMDGTFRYTNTDHEPFTSGTVIWDRSVDPAADPLVIKDES